jgi:NAD+ kinase
MSSPAVNGTGNSYHPHSPAQEQQQQAFNNDQPIRSPCFVHSHLDKGASLTEWLRLKQKQTLGHVGLAKSLRADQHNSGNGDGIVHETNVNGAPHTPRNFLLQGPPSSPSDDEDFGGSLTKQLAETAVTVREMSKQLGKSIYP